MLLICAIRCCYDGTYTFQVCKGFYWAMHSGKEYTFTWVYTVVSQQVCPKLIVEIKKKKLEKYEALKMKFEKENEESLGIS